MENSSIDGGVEPVGAESNKVPMILAIAAFVLGGLSFVFAWNTKSNLERYKANAQKEIQEAVEKASEAAAAARNAGNGGENAVSKTDVDELNARYDQIANSQRQIVENTKKVNERLARLENGGAANRGNGNAPAAAKPQQSGGSNAATGTSNGGKYKVQKGDYPAAIARKHGISLDEFNKANPGLDPKKLQIGQEVNIPEKK